jgi:hypothetical protein
MSHLKKLAATVTGVAIASPLQAAVNTLNDDLRVTGKAKIIEKNGAGLALGLEGFEADTMAVSELETSIQSLGRTIAALEGNYTPAQKEAALMAGMITGDISSFLRTDRSGGKDSMPAADGIGRILPAMESYDEKENKAAAVFTVAYNLQAARSVKPSTRPLLLLLTNRAITSTST